jgi:predicted HTH domain antitoxin
MKVITARISDKYFEDLEKIEKEEQADRAEVIRKLLAKGIAEWKLRKALELLREHKVTLRKAARFASVSYVEMLDFASKHGIVSGYSLEEMEKDIRNL